MILGFLARESCCQAAWLTAAPRKMCALVQGAELGGKLFFDFDFVNDRYFNHSFQKTTQRPPTPKGQGHRSFQLMGSLPDFCSSSLVLEKCLHPKNPLYTENGEG